MQGTVKWFSDDKGFGFITSADDQDYYFNVQGVKGSELPSTGDVVEFDSFKGHKGPRAKNVVIKEKPRLNKEGRDDRVTCGNCRRKVVPRLIVYNGEPSKSVCPFCAALISDFSTGGGKVIVCVIGFLIVMFIIAGNM
ncbi:cold shock domain-containing protein [bacterium Scap17]|nr:cold shock domain-containing protein [bacterium Scap17]